MNRLGVLSSTVLLVLSSFAGACRGEGDGAKLALGEAGVLPAPAAASSPAGCPADPLVETPSRAEAPVTSLETLDPELEKMTTPHWIEAKLATFPPDERRASPRPEGKDHVPIPGIGKFGEDLFRELSAPVEAVVEVAVDGPPSAREAAWVVLGELEDLVIPIRWSAPFASRSTTIALPLRSTTERRWAEARVCGCGLEPRHAVRLGAIPPMPEPT